MDTDKKRADKWMVGWLDNWTAPHDSLPTHPSIHKSSNPFVSVSICVRMTQDTTPLAPSRFTRAIIQLIKNETFTVAETLIWPMDMVSPEESEPPPLF